MAGSTLVAWSACVNKSRGITLPILEINNCLPIVGGNGFRSGGRVRNDFHVQHDLKIFRFPTWRPIVERIAQQVCIRHQLSSALGTVLRRTTDQDHHGSGLRIEHSRDDRVILIGVQVFRQMVRIPFRGLAAIGDHS